VWACDAIRIPRLIVYFFIRYYNIYIYMLNKVCTISDIYLNSNSRQNLNFARSQGGRVLERRYSLVAIGRRRRRFPRSIPAFKTDLKEMGGNVSRGRAN
jgi:hypothetical protein